MKITAVVYRRPNMFKVNENSYNMVGYCELENLFTKIDYKAKGKNLTLFYPERFINIVEQRSLTKRLEAAEYDNVHITTHSPFIIQGLHEDQVKISIAGENVLSEDAFEMSFNDIGMPDDSGLGVIGL